MKQNCKVSKVKINAIVVDGWYFTEHYSGATRYGIEVLKELDNIIEPNRYVLLLRSEYCNAYSFKNIRVEKYHSYNKYTRFFEIWKKVKNGDKLYINFRNGFAIGKNSIIVRHDLFSFYDVMNVSKFGIIRSKIRAYQSFRKAKKIVTVTNHVKEDICNKFSVNEDKVAVISNAWQHLRGVQPDDSVYKQYNLDDKGYYYFLGRLARNKNIDWIFKIADNSPQEVFVVSGELYEEKFHYYYGKNKNIIYTGGVTDEQMAALYIHCKGFLFPSLMEGFGIPPMEALYYGAPIIISNTSSLPEVYEDAAHYIDPYKYDYDLDKILKEPVADPQKILDKYSWEKSARQWYELIESFR